MQSILSINNIWKKYKIGGEQKKYLSLREQLSNILKPNVKPVDFWALKGITLDIAKGECVGFIGRNGAGKSTLLKILSKITPPTKGSIHVRGRVASLLEVGTGFHPELTGRENIYLNGSILGMRRVEINQKFDEIVQFSGVEQFLDTPLKHYSSGMKLRLAFSVAAHLESEILLIDEVLAVGDLAFQKKCLGKMDEVTKGGRTVLFVSHHLESLKNICSRGILLENGTVVKDGSIDRVINQYVENGFGLTSSIEWSFKEAISKNGIQLLGVRAIDNNGITKDAFGATENIIIEFTYFLSKEAPEAFIHGLNLFNANGENIFNVHDVHKSPPVKLLDKETIFKTTCIIPRNLLNTGAYLISVAFLNPAPFELFLWVKDIISFKVVEDYGELSARGIYKGAFPGVIRPLLEWNTQKIG